MVLCNFTRQPAHPLSLSPDLLKYLLLKYLPLLPDPGQSDEGHDGLVVKLHPRQVLRLKKGKVSVVGTEGSNLWVVKAYKLSNAMDSPSTNCATPWVVSCYIYKLSNAMGCYIYKLDNAVDSPSTN